jgi:hypothetical protein
LFWLKPIHLIFLLPPAKAGGILNEWQAQTEALEVKLFSTPQKNGCFKAETTVLITKFQ